MKFLSSLKAERAIAQFLEQNDVRSPAAQKGIRAGDVITEINERPIASIADATSALERSARNERALIVVQRGEQKRYVALALS